MKMLLWEFLFLVMARQSATLSTFAKYMNYIRWNDCSLRKIVKDVLSNHIRDKLWFIHKDISSFEGLKRAVLRINNDFRRTRINHEWPTPCSAMYQNPQDQT